MIGLGFTIIRYIYWPPARRGKRHELRLGEKLLLNKINSKFTPLNFPKVIVEKVSTVTTTADVTNIVFFAKCWPYLTGRACYKAANWIRVGQTKGTAKRGHDHLVHGKIKDVLLYPLAKGFRKKLMG